MGSNAIQEGQCCTKPQEHCHECNLRKWETASFCCCSHPGRNVENTFLWSGSGYCQEPMEVKPCLKDGTCGDCLLVASWEYSSPFFIGRHFGWSALFLGWCLFVRDMNMKGGEMAWRWLQKTVENRFQGLPRRAFLNSLSQELQQYPQLVGREEVVKERIEQLCDEGMQRHASLAVDSRAQVHLQMACLVNASYRTLLPWLGNDREKVMEIIRKPVGESAAGTVGYAQKFVLFFHLNKFKFASNPLKHMEADFGKAFALSHHESPGMHKTRVNRCLYHSVLTSEDVPELIPIFCALDRMWFDNLHPKKHGVEFIRPSTLANGDVECEFIVKKALTVKN